jgi:hypothetical protein
LEVNLPTEKANASRDLIEHQQAHVQRQTETIWLLQKMSSSVRRAVDD